MMESQDEDELVEPVSSDFPKAVLIAGIIWVIFGGSIFLMAALVYSMERPGAPMALSMWGFIFGAASVYIGIHTVRGTANGMWGNAIASLVFALLSFIIAVNHLVVGVRAIASKDANTLVGGIVLAGATSFVGVGFMAAGILALMGHRNYAAWRKAQNHSTSVDEPH